MEIWTLEKIHAKAASYFIKYFRESINLFKLEDLSELKNIDKRKEDQQEQDVKDRKEGFLTYVGESVLENDTPWYATKRGERQELADAEKRTKGK